MKLEILWFVAKPKGAFANVPPAQATKLIHPFSIECILAGDVKFEVASVWDNETEAKEHAELILVQKRILQIKRVK